MTKHAHTPGPWSADYDSLGMLRVDEVGPAGRVICDVALQDNADSQDEANARLIAAAPDLLEASSVVSNMLLLGVMPSLEACANLRAAITRAQGDSTNA